MSDRLHPFFCGTQHADWLNRNCDRCLKYPGIDELPDPSRCEIDVALGDDFCTGEGISVEMAKRMGYVGNEDQLTWDCPERRTVPGMQAVYVPGGHHFAKELLT